MTQLGKECDWRSTTQDLVPATKQPTTPSQYDLFPSFPVPPQAIQLGFEAIAEYVAKHDAVRIDGFVGVFWEDFRHRLDTALQQRGVQTKWIDVSQALRPGDEIEQLVRPFLGGDDPLFGTRFTGTLADFFDRPQLERLGDTAGNALTLFYGCGAGLLNLQGALVFVDLPKNELQFRSRAKSVSNLGLKVSLLPKPTYKRFYFVDWVALTRHMRQIMGDVDLFVDGQRPEEPTSIAGDTLRGALEKMSRNYFRVRPWFEPGPWGGNWIKQKISQLPQDVPNYAWSFELITPENGLLFEDGERLLEISFDWLMGHDPQAILGDHADRFGYEFPIRFDFLDTFDGGNLSVQCHPRPDYIKNHFGETFTQDETYYILDCKTDAEVYLGFVEGIVPLDFLTELQKSFETGSEIDIPQFVNTLPARKHDLFLIPHGTIHCSGINSLVLEISATPYIFTFKMYDWLRMDLEGNPRPLNIDRAFENLYFERQGDYVSKHLVSQPKVLASGSDWQIVHLPTHADHFYDVYRLEFENTVECSTQGSCHVMSLVEGESILLETADGMQQQFAYVETFVVPAAAGSYRLINKGPSRAKVIQAFLKKDPA